MVMISSSDLKDAEYFRKRAEEARTLTEGMLDAHTKSLMMGIAESCERIVKSYERKSYERIANLGNRTSEPK